MKSRFKSQFYELFMKVMGTVTVDESWTMNSIAEWDSLKHIQLIAELEDELNIQFEYEDIVMMNSIEKIDKILCKY